MPVDQPAQQRPTTLTDWMRVKFKVQVNGAARALANLGISPNALTLTGLLGHILAGFLAAHDRFILAGLILILLAPLDALDGALARLQGSPKPFGAFLDSFTDRYSEAILLTGLAYAFLQRGETWAVMAAYAAIVGSFMVSYARARGESLGFEVRAGLLSRVERYMILIPSLLLSVPHVGAVLVAVFANFTALQRAGIIFRQSQKRSEESE